MSAGRSHNPSGMVPLKLLWSALSTDSARLRLSTGSEPLNLLPCKSASCSLVHFVRSSRPLKLLPLFVLG